MGFLAYTLMWVIRIIVVIVAGRLIVFTMGALDVSPDHILAILLAAIVVILCKQKINGD